MRQVGSQRSQLVLYRNGTGRCTLLQSSNPSLSASNFDYVTTYTEVEYAKKFEEAADKLSEDEEYDPANLLDGDDFDRRYALDSLNVLEVTKGQGGAEWRSARPFHITRYT